MTISGWAGQTSARARRLTRRRFHPLQAPQAFFARRFCFETPQQRDQSAESLVARSLARRRTAWITVQAQCAVFSALGVRLFGQAVLRRQRGLESEN